MYLATKKIIKNTFTIFSILLFLQNNSIAAISADDQKYFSQFQDAFFRVEKDYVQEPDKQKMVDAAINGMLLSLDPHSSYFVDDELDDFKNHTKGKFGGIGVEIVYEQGAIKVVSPIDDLPAFKAGIKAGDYIVGVNGELVSSLGANKAIKEMRGTPGTKVKILVVKDEGVKPEEVELTREIVEIKPVKSALEKGDIGYIRLVTFNESIFAELKKEVKNLEEKTAAGLKGVILDLRNNPGGLLDQAISITDYFIPSGVIVSTKGRSSSEVVTEANINNHKLPNIPIVAIINAGTASASEIVAGALQDHKRAILIGTKSFGKGSVQSFVQINSRAGIKLTTAKYYTPSGRSIQAEGIEPDIYIEAAKVEYPENASTQLRFTESSLKNYLKNEDKNKAKNDDDKIAKAITDKVKSLVKDKSANKDNKNKEDTKKEDIVKKDEILLPSEFYKKDYQFARAYDLIRGLILSDSNCQKAGK